MTYRELLAALSKLNDTQLDQPVRWWGDEVGGEMKELFLLPEDYVDFENEGFAPRSTWASDPEMDMDDAEILPQGTPILIDDEGE